jgi:hypothetical protein
MLPKLLLGFFTQGIPSKCLFIELGDFGSCGLFVPPDVSIGNPWTVFQAELIRGLFTQDHMCLVIGRDWLLMEKH